MTTANETLPPAAVFLRQLPGPDRKRTPAWYRYSILYRNADAAQSGCAMTWEVHGGRDEYQISLERTARGERIWHCTCADAVYHEQEANSPNLCKHVRGLLACLPPLGNAPPETPPSRKCR